MREDRRVTCQGEEEVQCCERGGSEDRRRGVNSSVALQRQYSGMVGEA